ncbi:arylsulfatase [Nocardia carnea]|uniref:arylsulfatase n=1 Tax=Nocardia carnea TaxID=37328 RepID=UPI002457298E|nr:arylsulfatase [Nocardia carnea]
MNRNVLPIELRGAQVSPAIDIRDHAPAYEPVPTVTAPEGAPNVLLILLDDVGFGASSAFGGPCMMPTADRLSQEGLRYTRFHTTALCAPTRMSLLTGRNHHSAGMGTVPELATSAPGYTGIRPDSMATIARVLGGNGYATGAFGKMHAVPGWETTELGPFDRWPTGEGFDKFYGFLGAETNQFVPRLYEGTTPVDPPKTPEQGYHLSEDIVDQSIDWIRSVQTLDPTKPWFAHVSFGACHDPLHVPESWRGRYRGKFDHGWDDQRLRTFARQRELGIVPPDAQLPEWKREGIPFWDDQSDLAKETSARLMELYAEFAEHTDAQTGRLIDALEQLGELENTLIFYILGDNGAAAEGGPHGMVNLIRLANGVTDDPETIRAAFDELGSPSTYPHYPVGWAVAMDTPYQYAKKVASHYGGTRNGMIVSWPKGIERGGELRHQWHHCIDVVPTILEAAGLPAPDYVDGVRQSPIEGTSFAYTFNDPDAADRHTTQYFEMFGNRGIYHHGWTAVTCHRSGYPAAEGAAPRSDSIADDVWELYDTSSDWTQAVDVAAEFPEKLAELKQRFLIEAARHRVLPMDDRVRERFIPSLAGRRELMGGRTEITFHRGMRGLAEDAAPNFKNTSFAVTASITALSTVSANGVIIAQGGRFGGWTFFLEDGHLVYCHNLYGSHRTYVRATEPVPAGAHLVKLQCRYDGGGLGKGATIVIDICGRRVAEGRLDRTTPFVFGLAETLDIGIDRGTPVVPDYPAGPSNAFNGDIDYVRVELGDDCVDVPAEDHERIQLIFH